MDLAENDFRGVLPTELGQLASLERGFVVEPKEGTRSAVTLRLDAAHVPSEVAALSDAVLGRARAAGLVGAYDDDGSVWRASPPASAARYFEQTATAAAAAAADTEEDAKEDAKPASPQPPQPPQPKVEIEEDDGSSRLVTAVGDNASLRVAVAQWCRDPAAAEAEYGHISKWDTSTVTDMSHLFGSTGRCERHASFDEDITAWNGKHPKLPFFFCAILRWNAPVIILHSQPTQPNQQYKA